MDDTGTAPALGGSPSRFVTAGVKFCAAPDPLLDMQAPYFMPDLYLPGFKMYGMRNEPDPHQTVRSLCCEDPAFARSYRNHPSNFGKETR